MLPARYCGWLSWDMRQWVGFAWQWSVAISRRDQTRGACVHTRNNNKQTDVDRLTTQNGNQISGATSEQRSTDNHTRCRYTDNRYLYWSFTKIWHVGRCTSAWGLLSLDHLCAWRISNRPLKSSGNSPNSSLKLLLKLPMLFMSMSMLWQMSVRGTVVGPCKVQYQYQYHKGAGLYKTAP